MNDFEESIAHAREAALNCDSKPSLGAKPFFIAGTDRINELLGAIGRYVNEKYVTREQIRSAILWAVEVKQQLELIDLLMIYDREQDEC